MTIFVEARASEINIPNAKRVENLEAWSGADVMVSRLAMPCTTHALFKRHVLEGALLMQVKRGEDLAASATNDRLVESIARMRECTRRIPQHWLVFVGTLGCNDEGSALINGHRTRLSLSYATIDGAICDWIARGGVYYNVPKESMLPMWVASMERRLAKYDAQAYRYALSTPDYPDELPNADDPLQLPIRVRDARRVLVGFTGLGVETVNKVWEFCGHDFKSALAFLTDANSVGKLEGIGPKTIASIRRQCGLEEGDGYIGWGRDASDTAERPSDEKPSEEQLDKDMSDLFGKSAKRRKTKETA